MSHRTRHESSAGHGKPGAASHSVQTRDALVSGPSLTPCRAPGMGDACVFLLSFFIPPLSQGWTLLGGSGRAGGVPTAHAHSFLSSTTSVSLVAGWMLTIHLSAKINRSSFLPTGAEHRDTGTAAVAPGSVLLLGSVLPQQRRIHPSPLASAVGDGSHGAKVPVHWSWEGEDLKAA